MRVKWSQNFLTDRNIARKIVDGLSVEPDDTVLEIGPGEGILTELLLEKAEKVIAVEIDPSLCQFLKSRFGNDEKLEMIHKDFLEFPIENLKRTGRKKFKVIGNLPYAVLSPILQKILCWEEWSEAVFMVQKEVAQRIVSPPNSKIYGVLSVSVQIRSKVREILKVSKGCFKPVPNVDSAVLRFISLPNPFKNPEEEVHFYKTVRAAFGHRRKTILNSLAYSFEMPVEKLKSAIETCGLHAQARAETLSLPDFIKLSKILYNS